MTRLLVAGFGDIARRFDSRLPPGGELRAISRSRGTDLDRIDTLRTHAGWADTMPHTALPPAAHDTDTRTANLLSMPDAGRLTPGMLSFMGESRRLDNAKVKSELRIRLAHPTDFDGVAPLAAHA